MQHLLCTSVILPLLGLVTGSTHTLEEVTYSPNSMTAQWAKSLMATESTKSSVSCAQKCTMSACVHYQYNKPSGECTLYSAAIGVAPSLLTPLRIFTKDKCVIDKQESTSIYQDDWLVFVRRLDGSVDFQRPWADYRDGFGDPCGEFWLGLETLHQLTSSAPYKLRVEFEDWNSTQYFAEFSSFQVADESSFFNLSVSGYDLNSTASKAFLRSNGNVFTTLDVDNDLLGGINCAEERTGGWWYRECTMAHPTGVYFPENVINHNSVYYKTPQMEDHSSLKEIKMMVKA